MLRITTTGPKKILADHGPTAHTYGAIQAAAPIAIAANPKTHDAHVTCHDAHAGIF